MWMFLLSQIDEWMEEVGRSSRIAKVCSIGYSYEGRETPIIKVREVAGRSSVCVCVCVRACVRACVRV